MLKAIHSKGIEKAFHRDFFTVIIPVII